MNVMGIIFTNDASIGPLTEKRTMASLPFGGRYRQIDFALSNLCAAGVRHIGILSRHSYQSLMNHVGDGEEWGLELGEGGLEYLTPYAQSESNAYRGKLDSLHTSMDFLREGPEDELVVMIDSAIVSNVDLTRVLAAHIASGKDVTVVAKDGVCNGRKVTDLALRMEGDKIVDIACDYPASENYLASMDIFVARKDWLIDMVESAVAHGKCHMDRDLMMNGWQTGVVSVNVYPFDGVALFNESEEEYYHNTMALLNADVRANIFGANHPVWTKVRDRVPCYYGEQVKMENVLVADGCVLEGEVRNCVLFRQVTVESGAQVDDSIIMNDCVIGAGAQLRNVILDKEVVVAPGAQLFGTREHPILIKKGETV